MGRALRSGPGCASGVADRRVHLLPPGSAARRQKQLNSEKVVSLRPCRRDGSGRKCLRPPPFGIYTSWTLTGHKHGAKHNTTAYSVPVRGTQGRTITVKWCFGWAFMDRMGSYVVLNLHSISALISGAAAHTTAARCLLSAKEYGPDGMNEKTNQNTFFKT